MRHHEASRDTRDQFLSYLPRRSNDGCIILMSNIMMEGLHVNVGYSQQGMLLEVIEWVWFILGGKDGERKGGRMEGRREEGEGAVLSHSFG